MAEENPPVPANDWTATIFQLPPIDPEQLSGEDSIEITVRTRADGGAGMEKKTYRTTINAILAIFAARRDNPNQVTAAQVGTFSRTEIEDLLKEKLGVEDIAVNALKLDGKTREEIITEARDGTVKDSEQLGGVNASEYLLRDEFQQVMTNVTNDIDDIAAGLEAEQQ
ncbi:hypothetical protein PA10_00006 [Pseudomonas phage pPa_SNUABM_DT01]|nr:hypothetical protein PA10_00006 [Pseudomonas phage pPa_SNUABM_DT01]